MLLFLVRFLLFSFPGRFLLLFPFSFRFRFRFPSRLFGSVSASVFRRGSFFGCAGAAIAWRFFASERFWCWVARGWVAGVYWFATSIHYVSGSSLFPVRLACFSFFLLVEVAFSSKTSHSWGFFSIDRRYLSVTLAWIDTRARIFTVG